MDIHGTSNPDTYDESGNVEYTWHNYFGEGGNDTIKMKSGQAIGGPGDDYIEHVGTESWSKLAVAYWDNAPNGAIIDLQAGTALDGWGTTDTLVGVDDAHVSHRNDTVYGSSGDNTFSTGGGTDLFDGRAGSDKFVIGWVGNGPATPSKVVLDVSIDGRIVVITAPGIQNYRIELRDIEFLAYDWNQPMLEISSFIDPYEMASVGLVGTDAERWNANSAVGTAVEVSYSFVESAPASGPGATGFRAFTAAERQAVRDILASVSGIAGITFTEQSEMAGPAGQMRFGVSQQAATKGVAYMPSLTPGTAGDVWMDVESMAVLVPGSEGYAALLHEIGHALGLRHPRNVDPGDKAASDAQWREADDTSSLTVMSDSPSSDGLFRADWGVMDIAALRYLYGELGTACDSQTHMVGGTDAQAQRTIVDDGGVDVLDASASPIGVDLNLQAGTRSSVGVSTQGLVAVENLAIALGSDIENAIGSAHDDLIAGNAMDNVIFGGLGNDDIDGGAGTDIASFGGARADYALSEAFGVRYVEALDGVSGFDALVNIERLQFADESLAWDVEANPGLAVKILGAVVGIPSIVTDPYYIGVCLNFLDGGGTPEMLVDLGLAIMLDSNVTSQGVVSLVYQNLVGFAPSPADLAYYSGLIDDGVVTAAGLTLIAAETSYNLANIGYAGLLEEGVVYLP